MNPTFLLNPRVASAATLARKKAAEMAVIRRATRLAERAIMSMAQSHGIDGTGLIFLVMAALATTALPLAAALGRLPR